MKRIHGAMCMVVLVVLSAGCLGVLTGDKPLKATSDPVYVSNSGLEQAGYEHKTTEKMALNKSVEVNGQTREIRITNWMSRYAPSDDSGMFEAGQFVAFTSPSVEVLGQSVNPVAHMGDKEVIEMALKKQGGFDSLNAVGETEATVFGENTTVTEFEGTKTVDGQKVDITLHMAQVTHDGDQVVAFGAYPEGSSQAEDIFKLMESLERDNNK